MLLMKVYFTEQTESMPSRFADEKYTVFGKFRIINGEDADDVFVGIRGKDEKESKDWMDIGKKIWDVYTDFLPSSIVWMESDLSSEQRKSILEGWYYAQYVYSDRVHPEAGIMIDPLLKSEDIETQSISRKTSEAQNIARHLCDLPANLLTPESFAHYVKMLFVNSKVDVEVIEGEELYEKGFGITSKVGGGSQYLPVVVLLTYRQSDELPVGLVGKGVTFDSGGSNVKTAPSISEMKMDMGGAAAVTGALKLLDSLKAEVSVQAVIPLVANVADGHAILPSDVLNYPDGKSVEVKNTDGEGRLIIADAITYIKSQNIKYVIDIATLTGNIGLALGLKRAGVFSNNTKSLLSAYEIGQKTGDYVWPMPLEKSYLKYLDSGVAMISNVSEHPFAGAITAALFIDYFIEENMNWIHVDMANTVKEFSPEPTGASGFGVKLLTSLVLERRFIS